MCVSNFRSCRPFLNRKVSSKLLSLVLPLLLAASTNGLVKKAQADYPSLPLTIQLGPDAEDFNSLYKSGLVPPSSLSVLNGFDLSGRDLRLSKLHLLARELRNVNFDGADLTGSDLRETNFDNCSFRNAIMRQSIIGGGTGISPNCDLTGADLTGAIVVLSGDQLVSTLSYQRKDLSSCRLRGDFQGLSFAGFNLSGATLIYVGHREPEADNLAGCDFTDAKISDSHLRLTKEQLASTKEYKLRDLDGVTLENCDFVGMDFSRMSLGLFISCDLTNADLTDALFVPPVFHLRGFPSERSGFFYSPITREQFYSTWNFRRKTLPAGFEFRGMDLSGWDFRGMDLRGVAFRACNLSNALFDDARGGFFGFETITADQVRSTWNYKNNQMLEPGIRLHRDLAAEFSLQYPQ